MSRAKRIMIISDVGGRPEKMFLNQGWKLAKGFIRMGHDARIFSYHDALFMQSPIKSKGFAMSFFKDRADESLATHLKAHHSEIVILSFLRGIDRQTIERCREAVPDAVFLGSDGDPWPELQSNRIETAKALDMVTATNDGEFLHTYRAAGVPKCAFIPNVCDPDTDYRYEVSDTWKTNILWTGKTVHRRDQRRESFRPDMVGALARRADCRLYGCLGRPRIEGMDYFRAISGARIAVSVNAVDDVRLYHSDRLTHYLSCGTFVLAKRVPDTDLLFRDGQHIRYFETIDEFLDLAAWYLDHEAERLKIADAGMAWMHEQFNGAKIAGYLLDLVEKGSYIAPWTNG